MYALRRWTGILMTMSLLLLVGGAALAQEPSDPILKFDAESDIELDLAVMTDELLPLLVEALEVEGEEEAARLEMMIEMFGLRSLDRLHITSKSDKKGGYSKLELTLDGDEDTGLLGELFGVPAGRCGFAGYLDRDELTMLVSIQNLAGHLELLLDLLQRPEFADLTGDMPRNADGELEINGFSPGRDLLPLLSGELDLVLLDVPEGGPANPMALPVYLVFGTEDGPALRDLILELMALFAGDDAAGLAEMIRSMEPEPVGEFELTSLPMGGAFAVSEDYFVLGMTAEPLRDLLARRDGDLKVPDGRTWLTMNGEKYGRAMEGFMDIAQGMGGMQGESDMEDQWMALMYSNLFEHLESETIRSTSSKDRLTIEADVDGAVFTGMYGMLHGFLLELPEIVAMKKQEAEFLQEADGSRQIVGMLDTAFTQYGNDHDGRYPADPHELVDAGYLAEFPAIHPVPADEYADGGYTYHALRNEDGEVVGYYFFLYGGGEDEGWDVYTEENVGLGDDFFIDSDGQPDGVASFCYDGVALKQVETWN